MTREEFKERFPEWYQEMCELSEAIESAYHTGIGLSTASDIGPNAFVGFLRKTEDGKAELAKKEIVKAFDINKSILR